MTDVTPSNAELTDRFAGFVLGMAVGDALGLPREGLSRRRALRIFGTSQLQHGLFFGRGMVSDDTEHMRLTALALLAEPADSARFATCLASKLRWWLIALPAGVGLATARSIIRLWLGWPAFRSGVRSAGNGPAMRAGILGLCLHRNHDLLRDFVCASTRITHVDPQAEAGAQIIALATGESIRSGDRPIDPAQFLQVCQELTTDGAWLTALQSVESAVHAHETAAEFAARIGLERGVTGYMVHTVSAVLFCWLRWPGEFRRPVEEIVLLGGDADSTAAILGGLAGASCGVNAIPPEWLENLIEWPCSVRWMQSRLAVALHHRFESDVVCTPESRLSPLPWGINSLAILGRNLVFLVIVLAHGLRRLLPPY
ncbi:MAG: ADP-ribosylglycohydrolase family protein [Planctomycetes bacterium]|nr:ADP-ribosylglycohydrolase family protein [Planctomycetota bacterium]